MPIRSRRVFNWGNRILSIWAPQPAHAPTVDVEIEDQDQNDTMFIELNKQQLIELATHLLLVARDMNHPGGTVPNEPPKDVVVRGDETF